MIHELVIISGKGGTGKTSLTAALGALAQPVVLADCDVDAPDLHILASPRIQQTHPFSGGKKARIVKDECCGCGRCAAICRFDAIHQADGNDLVGMTYAVDMIACEGCGACVTACPAQAMRFEAVENGQWFVSDTHYGPMIHARLHPGEENSGKLVSTVRRKARTIATAMGLDLILVDGSPGVGCPVIASLTNAGFALIVAEPTPCGEHDAVRVMQLAQQMHVPAALCVNRWDISPSWTKMLETEAAENGVAIVGRVRDDPVVVEAQMHSRNIIEYTDAPVARDIRAVWERLRALFAQPSGRSPGANPTPSSEKPMLIAVPTEQGRLAGHFGRCREVSLFQIDRTTRQVAEERMLVMPPHEPGVFPVWLREQGVDMVIAGGMGPKALMLFAQNGIDVIIGADAQEPRELVAQFLAGELADGANTCSHGPNHHCEHESSAGG